MKKHRVAPELKAQIINRIKNDGISVVQAAKDHGISEATIYGWIAKKVEGQPSLSEIIRLKKENRQLLELVGEITLKLSDTFKHTLVAWLADASNGIHDLYATVIHATTGNFQTLCITNGPSDQNPVCVTKTQLAALLSQSAAAGLANPTPAASSSPTPASDPTPGVSSTDATDTPPVIQISGDNPAIIQVGNTYNDLGATITGPQADLNLGIKTFLNGTLTSNIVLDTTSAATDTTDNRRTRSMMEALRDLHVAHSPGASLFLFTTGGELRTSDPLSHTWHDGNGRDVRLI